MRLGDTTVDITPLGFGAAGIGNLYSEVSETDAREALEAAWRAGIRYFDTAPHYGLGLSERRLGAFLSELPRDEFVVSTKVGRRLEPSTGGEWDHSAGFAVAVWDFSADGIRVSLESSLERLGLDRVDVLLLHDPDDHWEWAIGEGIPALAELRAQGVVKAIGVGMNQWELPARFVREAPIDVVLLAGRYTLFEQGAATEFLPLCRSRGVSVLAAGVFNSGLLASDDVPDDATYDYLPAPPPVIERARRIARVCRRHGVRLPHAAVRFVRRHPDIAAVVLGMRSRAQVEHDAALFDRPVPEELWTELRAEGLLP